MEASGAVRVLRAALFAAVCVALAAVDHVLATGAAPPVWAYGAGLAGVFGAAVPLRARERSLPGIAGATLGVQGVLHGVFAVACGRAADAHGRDPGRPGIRHRLAPAATHFGAAPAGARHTAHATAPHLALAHPALPHATAAHFVAALVTAWWLWRGEAALWSLLRRAAALVPGLAAWWSGRGSGVGASPGPAPHPYTSPARPKRQALLRHAVSRRGPPDRNPYPTHRHTTINGTEFLSCPNTTPRSGAPCAGPPSPPASRPPGCSAPRARRPRTSPCTRRTPRRAPRTAC
ncbi:hypothetical protein [Streptomyces melanogenes]|uniref:hypothetical protein n=1 Tax=Streptomyces melanogenes TaxID=67326 RepID=UPI0037B19738